MLHQSFCIGEWNITYAAFTSSINLENEIEEFPPNTIGADLKNNDHDVVEDDDDFFVTLNIIISYIVLTIFVIYILLCFILKKLCFSFYSLCPALLCLMKALGLTNETLHMLQ